jgi:hypothetical protein
MRRSANPSRDPGRTGLLETVVGSRYFGTGLVPTVIPGVASHFQLSISVVVSSDPSPES